MRQFCVPNCGALKAPDVRPEAGQRVKTSAPHVPHTQPAGQRAHGRLQRQTDSAAGLVEIAPLLSQARAPALSSKGRTKILRAFAKASASDGR